MSEMLRRMLDGELYHADDDAIRSAHARARAICDRFNATAHDADAERDAILRELCRSVGEGVVVRPSFRCDYGTNLDIGAGTFINFDAVVLDVVDVVLGRDCQLATRVQLLTATHPVDPGPRRAGWESGAPIVLEDNVWLGGGVIVCPGVTIGRDTVVGAGAVVTKDLPSGVVAVGVPARVLRDIDERDRVDPSRLPDPRGGSG